LWTSSTPPFTLWRQAVEPTSGVLTVSFGACEWAGTKLKVDSPGEPNVDLRNKRRKCFVLVHSFVHGVPVGDPDEDTIFVVTGDDAPLAAATAVGESDGRRIVIPRNESALASVPWYPWWLVARSTARFAGGCARRRSSACRSRPSRSASSGSSNVAESLAAAVTNRTGTSAASPFVWIKPSRVSCA